MEGSSVLISFWLGLPFITLAIQFWLQTTASKIILINHVIPLNITQHYEVCSQEQRVTSLA